VFEAVRVVATEECSILGDEGIMRRAARQPLGAGIYRTPDDPTTLQDLIDARSGHGDQ
jgi:hypothetical protein